MNKTNYLNKAWHSSFKFMQLSFSYLSLVEIFARQIQVTTQTAAKAILIAECGTPIFCAERTVFIPRSVDRL
jgi:hypothetical protein